MKRKGLEEVLNLAEHQKMFTKSLKLISEKM